MTLDFTCQVCDASFEVDLADLLDEPRVQCPSCEARAPRPLVEGLASALDDLSGHLVRLQPRFVATMEIASEDLAATHERAAAAEDDEEDEERPHGDEEPDEGVGGFRSDE
jgi:hypothetical protein